MPYLCVVMYVSVKHLAKRRETNTAITKNRPKTVEWNERKTLNYNMILWFFCLLVDVWPYMLHVIQSFTTEKTVSISMCWCPMFMCYVVDG